MADVLSNYVKFLRGTPEAYSKCRKDPDTLYFVSVEGESVGQLWIGDKLITMETTDDGILNYLYELADVDTAGVKNGDVLTWSDTQKKWIVSSLGDAVKVSNMVGATASADGIAGLVPAPKAGENKNFFKGDGTWSALTIADIINLQSTLDSLVNIENFNTELNKKVDSSELDSIISEINLSLSNKLDKDTVYTKTETDTVIAAAIAEVSHLQRKIVDSVQDIYDYINKNSDADKYIFMVPSGLSQGSNKYYEYIVIYDENNEYIVEQVGDWEVSLDDYVTNDILEEVLKNKVDKVYYTIPVLDENGNLIYEEDGVTPKTEQVEGTLLSPTDKNKLDSLVITEDGIEISGTVNAENVQGLEDWIEKNRNSVNGLLSIDLENKINSIGTTTNELSNSFKEMDVKITNLEDSLNNYVLKDSFEDEIATINTDISTLKKAFSWAEIN